MLTREDIDRIVAPSRAPAEMRQLLKDKETHNGWPNIETWTVHLWLTNDAQAYASCREIAEDEESDLAAGEAIRDRWCDPLRDSAGPSDGLLCDMLTRAFTRVDWQRIGAAFREV